MAQNCPSYESMFNFLGAAYMQSLKETVADHDELMIDLDPTLTRNNI